MVAGFFVEGLLRNLLALVVGRSLGGEVLARGSSELGLAARLLSETAARLLSKTATRLLSETAARLLSETTACGTETVAGGTESVGRTVGSAVGSTETIAGSVGSSKTVGRSETAASRAETVAG